jgi:hypothetical protein
MWDLSAWLTVRVLFITWTTGLKKGDLTSFCACWIYTLKLKRRIKIFKNLMRDNSILSNYLIEHFHIDSTNSKFSFNTTIVYTYEIRRKVLNIVFSNKVTNTKATFVDSALQFLCCTNVSVIDRGPGERPLVGRPPCTWRRQRVSRGSVLLAN